jgi:lysine 2,3-aminomutase
MKPSPKRAAPVRPLPAAPERRTLRTPAELVAAGLVTPEEAGRLEPVARRYAVAVTPTVAGLIDPANPADPIARQYIPDPRELEARPEESADPIGDEAHSPLSGLVHRYPDRVLLKLTGLCPVYCRFCFRREMVGPEHGHTLTPDEIAAAIAFVRDRPRILEVIVTGGDPLVLSPRRIAALSKALAAIPHLEVVRWHTRLPVAAPEKVTTALVGALYAGSKAVFVGVHANHPRELTPEARAAIRRLIEAGFTLLGQTVLLKGVNDNVETLAALMRGLVAAGVKPYYLHHADFAPGTAHFRTTIAEGQALMRALRGRISGLAQPTYVVDIPGGLGKVPIGPHYLDKTACGDTLIEDYRGIRHVYPLRPAEGDAEA